MAQMKKPAKPIPAALPRPVPRDVPHCLRPGDEPDADSSRIKPNTSRHPESVGKGAQNVGNRRTQNRRHRRDQSHVAARQCPIEEDSARPPSALRVATKLRWQFPERRVGQQSDRAYHNQTADMDDGREQKMYSSDGCHSPRKSLVTQTPTAVRAKHRNYWAIGHRNLRLARGSTREWWQRGEQFNESRRGA